MKAKFWIARDGAIEDMPYGNLHLFEFKPHRVYGSMCNYWELDNLPFSILSIPQYDENGNLAFPEITWKSEPVEVELEINNIKL